MVFRYGEPFTLTERCNKRKLAYLIHNYDSIDWGDKQPDLESMKKYFYRLNSEGHTDVVFEQKDGEGRYFAKGPSLSNMSSSVRNTICDEHKDQDIVNCGTTMLLGYIMTKVQLLNPKHLSNYYHNREELIQDAIDSGIFKSRTAVKEFIISIIYGAKYKSIDKYSQWIQELYNEVSNMGDFIKGLNPAVCQTLIEKKKNRLKADKKPIPKDDSEFNVNGMILSYIVNNMETIYMISMMNEYASKGIDIITYTFDGFMIDDKHSVEEITPIASKWAEMQSDKAYELVKFINKPFKSQLSITEEMMADIAFDGTIQIVKDQSYTTEWLDDPNQLYDEFKQKFDQIVQFIRQDGKYIRLRPNGQIDICEEGDLMKSYKTCEIIDPEYKPRNSRDKPKFLRIWLNDLNKITYEQIVFKPTPLTLMKGDYNLWKGFKHEMFEPSLDTTSIDMISSFIQSIFKTPDEALYIMDWISTMIQQPGIKPAGGALVLYSAEQGTGKNTLCDIITALIGQEYAFTTEAPERDIWGTFNNNRQNKLLIVIDEADPKENHIAADKIKSLITQKEMTISIKNQSTFTIQDFSRYIFTTNSSNSMSIHQGERRMACFELSSIFKGNSKYFEELYQVIDDEEQMRDVFYFFKNRKITRDIVYNRPDTNLRQLMVDANVPPIQRWIGSFINELKSKIDIADSLNTPIDESMTDPVMKSKELFDLYKQYCTDHGFTKSHNTINAFNRQMMTFTGEFNTAIPGVAISIKDRSKYFTFDVQVCNAHTHQWVL